MSLRRRLSVLVAIALAPSLLLSAFNAARWKIFLEDEANSTALSAARFVSAEFELVIENSRQLMTAMTKYPSVLAQEEECSSYFKSVIADIPIYREATIIDTDGKFHCSTIPIPPTTLVIAFIFMSRLNRASLLWEQSLKVARIPRQFIYPCHTRMLTVR
jgi:hypothetical protein